MIRVGEEAGVLPRVMSDLADLLEHEDEVRSEVISAVAYPLFVLGFRRCHRDGAADLGHAPVIWHAPGNVAGLCPADADSAQTQRFHASLLARRWSRTAGAAVAAVGTTSALQKEVSFGTARKLRLPIMGSVFRGCRFEPICPNPGHPRQERRVAPACPQNCRKHDWQPCSGPANRPGSRGNPRRRFAGRSASQAGYLSREPSFR